MVEGHPWVSNVIVSILLKKGWFSLTSEYSWNKANITFKRPSSLYNPFDCLFVRLLTGCFLYIKILIFLIFHSCSINSFKPSSYEPWLQHSLITLLVFVYSIDLCTTFALHYFFSLTVTSFNSNEWNKFGEIWEVNLFLFIYF